jgi:hypothetical protein
MSNAEARSWWADVQHLRPDAPPASASWTPPESRAGTPPVPRIRTPLARRTGVHPGVRSWTPLLLRIVSSRSLPRPIRCLHPRPVAASSGIPPRRGPLSARTPRCDGRGPAPRWLRPPPDRAPARRHPGESVPPRTVDEATRVPAKDGARLPSSLRHTAPPPCRRPRTAPVCPPTPGKRRCRLAGGHGTSTSTSAGPRRPAPAAHGRAPGRLTGPATRGGTPLPTRGALTIGAGGGPLPAPAHTAAPRTADTRARTRSRGWQPHPRHALVPLGPPPPRGGVRGRRGGSPARPAAAPPRVAHLACAARPDRPVGGRARHPLVGARRGRPPRADAASSRARTRPTHPRCAARARGPHGRASARGPRGHRSHALTQPHGDAFRPSGQARARHLRLPATAAATQPTVRPSRLGARHALADAYEKGRGARPHHGRGPGRPPVTAEATRVKTL